MDAQLAGLLAATLVLLLILLILVLVLEPPLLHDAEVVQDFVPPVGRGGGTTGLAPGPSPGARGLSCTSLGVHLGTPDMTEVIGGML